MKKTSNLTFVVTLISICLLSACSPAASSAVEPSATLASSGFLLLGDACSPPSNSAASPPCGGYPQLPGTYYFPRRSISDYQRIIFTLPAGWAAKDGLVCKYLGKPIEMAFSAWVPDKVYTDPCHWQGSAAGFA